jgi:hypothetical protein
MTPGQRTRRGGPTPGRPAALLLIALAVVGMPTMASVASAQTPEADQTVRVEVENLTGTLGIEVASPVDFGVVTAGSTSGEATFGMVVTNVGATGWDVTVTATDLLTVETVCEGDICTDVPDGYATIAKSNIHVRGGEPVTNPDSVTTSAGTLGETPLTIMTGTATAWGTFAVDTPSPAVWLDIPSESPSANYVTTLTYTIMGATS